MSFSRVNPLGWALFEELTSAQMNQLDIDHANAIDGVDGGTYTLNNPLTIGGDTVNIADLVVTGTTGLNDITVTGFALFTGTTFIVNNSGNVWLTTSAGDVAITASGGDIDIDANDNLRLEGGSTGVDIVSSAYCYVDSAGLLTLDGSTGVAVTTATGDFTVSATGTGANCTLTADTTASTGGLASLSGMDVSVLAVNGDLTLQGDIIYVPPTSWPARVDLSAATYGLHLSSATDKAGNAYIEYADGSQRVEKLYNILTNIVQAGSWDVSANSYAQVTSFTNQAMFLAFALPRRTTALAEFEVFFNSDTAPTGTGLEVDIYEVTRWDSQTQIGVTQTQPLGSHVGDNTLTTISQGDLAITGFVNYMLVRIQAPVGGTSVVFRIFSIRLALKLAGMGSW